MLRNAILASLACALGLAATGATAAASDRATVSAQPAPVTVHGDFCTPYGCAGAQSAPASKLAGFAIAVVTTGWIARRRPTDRA